MNHIKSVLDDKCMVGFDASFNPAHFLFEKKCFLRDYNFSPDTRLFIPAGNIIDAACRENNINQRMILVTLQRETSAISCTDVAKFGKLTNYADGTLDRIDWICCCGVPDNPANLNPRFKGFQNQIIGACKTYRRWYDAWKPGQVKELVPPDKELQVIPDSAITNSLLFYTPHVDAMSLTEKLYKQYFGS